MEEYQDHSLRGKVFQKVREDILSGVYKEHEELRETVLSKKLGVSRTPVREALRQLELEGLVTMIPNKGAYVTGISQKDVYDIYRIRSVLEGLCARWATEHITEEQIEGLESSFYPNFIWNAPANRPGRSQNLTESSTKSCTKPPIVVYWNMYYRIFISMYRRPGPVPLRKKTGPGIPLWNTEIF